MSSGNSIACRLAVLTAGLTILLGCSHAPVQRPLDLASAAVPVARGQMADDIRNTPPLAITEGKKGDCPPSSRGQSPFLPSVITSRPNAYDQAVVQANPAAPNDPPATPPPSDLHRLWQQAATHFATVNTYSARVHRREQVNGKNGPDEWQLFKWRKQPWSVYFRSEEHTSE